MADYKVSARVEADTSRFKRQIDTAKRAVENLKRTRGDVEITADISKLRAAIRRAKEMMRSFKNDKTKVNLDADASAATSKINRLKLMLKSIPNKIRTKVSVDLDKNQLAQFAKEFDRIKGASDKFDNRMQAIANSIRTFGTVIGNQIKGSLIASFSAAIPVIATLVPAVMAVGNAIAVVGGGAIGAAGAFGILYTGVAAFAGMATTAIKMLNDGTIEASDATGEYEDSLSGLKSAWESVVSSNASSIFYAMAAGMRAATSAVQQLTPFLSGVAKVVELNAQKFHSWVTTSSTAAKAFKMLNTVGVQIFNDMLSAVGRFGDGFVNVFTQFAPLFKFVSQGFQNMATDFQAWASSMSTAKGIENFINYTKTNLPIIGKIFGNTFLGLFNLFKAFGTNSQSIFVGLEKLTNSFKKWSETVGASNGFQKFMEYVSTMAPKVLGLIGGLVMALVNFGIAMAPIGAAVLGVVTAFAQWIAKLFETNPAIARLLGIAITLGGILMAVIPTVIQLATAFTEVILPIMRMIQAGTLVAKIMQGVALVFGMLTSPIAIAIAAVLALAAVFIYLWTTNEGFRNAVIAIWEQIKTFISTAVQIISSVVMAIWGALVAWWQANNESILNVVTTVWNFISTLINSVITAVSTFVMAVFGALVAWWQANNQLILQTIQTVWNLIAPVVTAAINIVVNIIKVGWELVKTVTQVAWNALVTIIKVVWTIITTAVQVAITAIGAIIRAVMQVINGDWQGAWNTIKAAAQTIWNLIKSAAITIFNALKTGVLAIWNALKSGTMSILNALKGLVQAVWNGIKAVVQSVMNVIKSVVTSIWNAIKAVVTSVVNAIKAVITSVFNAIKSFIQSSLNGWKMIITSVWNAIKSLITSVVNAIRSVITSVFNAIRSVIQSVMSGIQSVIQNAWNTIKSVVTNAVNTLKSAVQDGFNNIKNIVQNTIGQLPGIISGKAGEMLSAGTELIAGVLNGIKNKANEVIGYVKDLAGKISGAFKSALSIHSPSRVMIGIAKYIPIGAAKGIAQYSSTAVKEAVALANGVSKAFDPSIRADFSSVGQDLKNATASVGLQASQSFQQNINVPQSNVNITMDINNDALVAIVDEQHADNSSFKKFNT